MQSSSRRGSALLAVIAMVALSPLLGGCLERSTTVGDRFSGTVIVASSPDNPRGVPRLDIPDSMAGHVSLSEYEQSPDDSSEDGEAENDEGDEDAQGPALVGTRASYNELTTGQFSQLGDIVAGAFGDSAMTMDLTATRSDDVVRFRGATDMTELSPGEEYLRLSVVFDGPVTATNGDQTGDRAVTWTPPPGEPADLSADSTYADPATAAMDSWAWFMAAVCLVVILVIVRLAYTTRYRGPRPGRPGAPGRTASGSGRR